MTYPPGAEPGYRRAPLSAEEEAPALALCAAGQASRRTLIPDRAGDRPPAGA
jgi:hypothetical protein